MSLSPRPDVKTADAARRVGRIGHGATIIDHAERAANWLAKMAPDARTVIVALHTDGAVASIMAADATLTPPDDCGFPIYKDSIWRRAVNATQITHAAVTDDLRRRLPWGDEIGVQRSRLACLAAPQIAEGVIIAVFHDPATKHGVDSALASLATLLSKPDLAVPPDPAIYSAIRKAKREWERTVDALDQLVLLLDMRGTVLRANRTLERWGLAKVDNIRGRSVHRVLHPNCRDESCRFARLLRCRWNQMHDGESTAFELFDTQLDKALQVTLQPIAEIDESSTSSFGVVVVKDVTELHQTQNQLRQLNGDLEHRVQDRTRQLRIINKDLKDEIARRQIVEHELHASRNELSRLSAKLLDAQENERRRIALELHDSLGQSLGALKYSLERCVAVNANPDLGNPVEVLKSSVSQLQKAIGKTRSIAMSLRPSLLDDMGAASAVQWLGRWFGDTYADIDFVVDCQLTDAQIPEQLAAPLYRICQESLNYAATHANAHNVLMRLHRIGNKLVMEVRDDGDGCDLRGGGEPREQQLVIVGIRERVTVTGGDFSVESGSNIGNCIRTAWELAGESEGATQ